jgi:hypothetical protein
VRRYKGNVHTAAQKPGGIFEILFGFASLENINVTPTSSIVITP